ncbi:amino acid adenylation domain-containing protein [Jatrophihabitans endophyticus]|uniref:Amino acid adenylation domain-containing protein n=1 Tax=Jatrophihabitans endophyticus TaxID=1206085 RepID=A0A1M5I627_9ACTN|nr:amino acid adenylation domain-containing protein [Jatrophihabitans endophyticus]SHG23243.1 amino acid adenylation domain-containing protein [Jatrophihabitans endophyticus]
MRAEPTLHERYRAVAREHAGRPAVTCGSETVTHGDLLAAAEAVAATLAGLGVRPGDRVGLVCERGIGLLVGMVGIVLAGAAYVPVDPDYPPERIDLLVQDSGIEVAVTDGPGRAALAPGRVRQVDVASADGAAAAPTLPSDPDVTAYVIYTSGSTGRPKGVLVSHRNVVRLFDSTAHWFGFDETDVWTLFHSPSFDFSVWEIWGALLHGGRLVVVSAETVANPLLLLELLRDERVTVLNQTPSAFRLLAAVGCDRGRDLALRTVVFGGERLDVALLGDWFAAFGDEEPRLVNMYGITETTVHVTYRHVRLADLARPDRSPIGMPIPDLTVTIRDADGTVVPDGEPGEIWVAGAGVATGYLNRPELTAARFVDDGGDRAYRSGDLGVVDDGELVHQGRLDDQLKVRGFRIEPFEVEAALLRHPGLAAAVVSGKDYGAGDVRLVAYVQAVDGAADDLPAVLREHARAHLPAHLRPSDYLPVERIPLTAQGKVDRTALAAGTGDGTGIETTVQRRVAAIR